jgi:uncharacterized protein (TIGR02246 family)
MGASDVATQIAAHFAGAWNRHDMEEFGRLFHEDAAFVNVVGVYMHGRAEIQQRHSVVHAGPYRDSRLFLEVEDVRELAPNVIVAHLSSQLSGDERAPGETRHSRFTIVIEQRPMDDWKIGAAHNTFVTAVGEPRS